MRKLFNWFRRGKLETELDRELSYHVDRRVADLIHSGMSENEARRTTAIELGGATQVREEVRDIWLTRWLRDFVYDLRFSVRSFLHSPSFTATAVLSLALGIGATTAIYSLLDQVVRRALPVREPEQLALIDWKGDQGNTNAFGSYNLMSYPICLDLHAQKQIFNGVLCRAATTVSLSTGGEHSLAAAELVSGSYFSTLGVNPALGKLFSETDGVTPGTIPLVVLSHNYWKTRLGGATDIVGRKVLVNRYPMTVIGVAAEGFNGVDVGEVPAVWIPALMSAQAIPGFDTMLSRRTKWMQVLGRLRHDVSLAQAQSGLQPWFRAMREQDTRREGFPNITADRKRSYFNSTLEITPAAQGHSSLRRNLTRPLYVLFVGTALLLALACLNVAGLFLARGSAREREITTRLALGASRGRIGRQLIADSMIFAIAGGVVGALLAPFAIQALIALMPGNIAANALESVVDSRLLLFTFLVSLATGILTGVAPALQAGRGSLITHLRERGGTASRGLPLRKIIVTAQIALTLILVIAAGLYTRTLAGLMIKGPGFDTSSLISFGIYPIRNGYTPVDAARLVRRVHDEIRASAITQSSAISRIQMLTGGSWNNPLTVQADKKFDTDREVHLNSVSAGFFSMLGSKIIAGRDFDERDSLPKKDGAQKIVIVNEAFAKRYFAGRSPLGARIAIGTGPDQKPDTEIVGVVSNISYRGVREQWEQAFFPLETSEAFYEAANYYVRIRGTSDAGFQTIRDILRKADPALPINYLRTLDEQVNRSLSTERMLAVLSAGFGTLALVLSLVGLYGVMSFVVSQRTREIGIRLALGATRATAVWMVLRDALLMIAAGVSIALPCVWALGRLVESQLYDITPTDPITIFSAAAVLSLAAFGAALIPARRASTVNPTEALRFE